MSPEPFPRYEAPPLPLGRKLTPLEEAMAAHPCIPVKQEAERIHLGSFPPTVPALRSWKMELGNVLR